MKIKEGTVTAETLVMVQFSFPQDEKYLASVYCIVWIWEKRNCVTIMYIKVKCNAYMT